MERDPVCGMEVRDIIKSEATVYKGKTYYFCSSNCKTQFEKNPEKYVKEKDIDDHTKHQH